MEKEIGLLRCSKLNCYTEFNKMVQALAHCEQPSVYTIPGARKMHGTSTEYNFYTTLITLLQQVMSNNRADSELQKRELQRLYEWFTMNKPLIRSKTKLSARKPSLSFTSKKMSQMPLQRPQTAPATLYKLQDDGNVVPTPQREFRRTRPRTSFTSAYISTSHGHNLDLIGKTFDQLALEEMEEMDRPKTDTHQQNGIKSPFQVATQAHPSPSFLANYTPPGFAGVHPHLMSSVCFGELFSLAPSVGAQMTIDREVPKERELNYFRKILTIRQIPETPQRNFNTPVTEPPPVVCTTNSEATTRPQEPTNPAQDQNNSKSMDVTRELSNNNCLSTQPPLDNNNSSSSKETRNAPLIEVSSADNEAKNTNTMVSQHQNANTLMTSDKLHQDKEDNRQDERISVVIQNERDSRKVLEEEEKPYRVLLNEKSVVITTRLSQPERPAITKSPRRPPSVVSITFPVAETRPSSSGSYLRNPPQTPSVVAGFKKSCYRRPQTVANNHKRCIANDLFTR